MRESAKTAIELHKPELMAEPGSVIQVWSDGEITCQKSGRLLWLRTLHRFDPPVSPFDPADFPVVHGESSYAVVEREEADEIRNLMRKELC